jgi:tRNA1(Val) A37 N6-methylase TrmN6
MKVEKVKLTQVAMNDNNPRSITDTKFAKLVNNVLSFPKMLELRPIVVSDEMKALGGNMRLRALQHIAKLQPAELDNVLATIPDYAKASDGEREAVAQYWHEWLKQPTAPVVYAATLTAQEQRRFIILDNVGFGDWDWDELANNWDGEELGDWGLDNWGAGDGWNEGSAGDSEGAAGGADGTQHGTLADRFVVPPFSVLDTRQGYWKERKVMWRDMIGDNGESRENTLSNSQLLSSINNGVSILDPVMAEIVCRWFGIEGGAAFDCFAGDTIFGYVSAYLGMNFTGIELREEQAKLNNERVQGMKAKYICDDGQNVTKHIAKESQDLFFSCPPYFNLEIYSDDPKDASNQPTYEEFIKIIETAFAGAITCLKQNRFACVVVGDIRAKDGFYYGFVDDIKRIFAKHGMRLYNEMIIVEPIGTLPQRVARYMRNRKIGKCHQNVLVFYKGDTKEIANQFKEIKYASEDLEQFNVDNGNATATA